MNSSLPNVLPFSQGNTTPNHAPSGQTTPVANNGYQNINQNNLGYSGIINTGGGGPTDGERLAVLETNVGNIKKDLARIEDAQTTHFWAGIGAIVIIFTAIILSYLLLDSNFSNKFGLVDERFKSLEEKVSNLQVSSGEANLRLKHVEERINKIPTKDEMIGIIYQALNPKDKK